MEYFTVSLLNGVIYGLLLFMVSAGLTLIFGMMGVLNFAHASFYMIGAYAAYTLTPVTGFWAALVLATVISGALGMAVSATSCAACTSSATRRNCWSLSAWPSSWPSWSSCSTATSRSTTACRSS